MNYHRDRRFGIQKRKLKNLIFLVLAIVIVIFFRRPIVNSFEVIFQKLGHLIWLKTNEFKSNEGREQEELKARLSDYNTILHENILLKEIFYREQKDLSLA